MSIICSVQTFQILPVQLFPDDSISEGLWQTSVRLTAGLICVWSYIRAASTHTITQKQQAGRSLKTVTRPCDTNNPVRSNIDSDLESGETSPLDRKTPHCPHRPRVLIDRILTHRNAAINTNKTFNTQRANKM